MQKNILIAGIIITLVGAYLSGALESLLSGDTGEHLRLFGGAIGLAIGTLMIRKGILSND